MSIGKLSKEDFDREMNEVKKPQAPSVPPEIINIPKRGRSDGDVNVPDSLRKIIGETSILQGRQAALDLAGQFGISASSVSAYAKGATSTDSYNEPKRDIVNHLNKSRYRAVGRASKTLNSALATISQEKLDYSDAKDLAGIAKDMSVIIKNLEPQPETASDDGNKPQFVIYAPTFRNENSYETIVAKDE